MTIVSTATSSGPYAAAATTTFAVDFYSSGADEIEVTLDGEVLPPSSYTFSRDDDGTGEVVTNDPLTGEVYILSKPNFLQTTDFQRFGPWFPDRLNPPLDRAAARDLYLKERLDRAPVVPLGGGVNGLFPVVSADGTWTFSSGTGADADLRGDLAGANGGEFVGFKPGLAPAVARTLSMQSLFDGSLTLASYLTFADSGTADDATDVIGAANEDNWREITHAIKSRPYAEPHLLSPPGYLPIAQMDWTTLGITDEIEQTGGMSLTALGRLTIVGTDGSKGFVFGSDLYSTGVPWLDGGGNPIDPPFIRPLDIWGPRVGISARLNSPGVFEKYDRGLQLEAFVDSKLRLGVSGDFGDASADRIAVEIDMSFNNELDISVSHPGNPGVGHRTILLYCGPNSVNRNQFKGRIAGPGAGIADVIGVYATGADNYMRLDISAVETALIEDAGQGNTFALYCEAVKNGYSSTTAAFALGTTLLGGKYDILAGGIARNLNYTKGFTSIGGVRKFTGASTVDVAYGTECYGPSLIGGTYATGSAPASTKTGTSNLLLSGVPDDFMSAAQGTFILVNSLAIPTGTNLVTWKRDEKWYRFNVVFTAAASADTNPAVFTGCPIAPAGTSFPTWNPAYDQGDRDLELIPVGVNNWRVRKISTGAIQTNAQISGKVFAGTIEMFIA